MWAWSDRAGGKDFALSPGEWQALRSLKELSKLILEAQEVARRLGGLAAGVQVRVDQLAPGRSDGKEHIPEVELTALGSWRAAWSEEDAEEYPGISRQIMTGRHQRQEGGFRVNSQVWGLS